MEAAHELQIFPHGQIGRDCRLLRRHADGLFNLGRVRNNTVAQKVRVPACRLRQAGKHLNRGRLSRAVDSEQGKQLPLAHRQIQSVNDGQILVFLRQVLRFDCVHTSCPSFHFLYKISCNCSLGLRVYCVRFKKPYVAQRLLLIIHKKQNMSIRFHFFLEITLFLVVQ